MNSKKAKKIRKLSWRNHDTARVTVFQYEKHLKKVYNSLPKREREI